MTIELGVVLTALLVVGFLAQWLAWRMRLPAILFLPLIGIALGEPPRLSRRLQPLRGLEHEHREAVLT